MFNSLYRGLPRIMTMLALGILFYLPADVTPLALGPTFAPVFNSVGVTFFGLAIGDAALRILQPYVDSQAASKEAMRDANIAAGLVYLGRSILAAVIMLIVVSAGRV